VAYTDPITISPGDTGHAADWNTYVRDNFTSLGRDAADIKQIGTTPWERWYALGQVATAQPGTYGTIVDRLLATPFVSPRGGTIDRLGFEVTTGGSAGSKLRVGIYKSTSPTNIYPDALVVDGGEYDTTTTGVKATTVSVALEPDVVYWACFIGGTAFPTVRALPDTAFLSNAILGFPSTIGGNRVMAIYDSRAYGALPATFMAAPPDGFDNNSSFPIIAVRYSA
jgi:hypothetical protein